MARKILSHKAMREMNDAAERAAAESGGDDGEGAPKKKAAKKATTTKRKTRAKADAADIRVKLFWGVFNQSLKRVALYDFNQRKQADKKAEELTAKANTPHFVQKVKEPVQE